MALFSYSRACLIDIPQLIDNSPLTKHAILNWSKRCCRQPCQYCKLLLATYNADALHDLGYA